MEMFVSVNCIILQDIFAVVSLSSTRVRLRWSHNDAWLEWEGILPYEEFLYIPDNVHVLPFVHSAFPSPTLI